ncbi:MAG: hypothetical protein NUW02_01065 [Candidatus Campbellbacteria bacterium]|nr:hypothetical protein [Candidatus Campbellbacteria bacterium]
MNEESQKIIKEKFAQLPPALQKAFTEIDLLGRVRNIITKNNLRVDDGGLFEDEVMFILLGLEHPNNFIANLTTRLHVPLITIEKLVIDVEKEVFLPVRESLMKMFPTGEHGATPEKLPVAPATSQQHSPTVIYPQKPAVQAPVSQAVPPANLPITPQPQTAPGLTRTLPKDIVQTKLEQSFRMPPTTTTIKESTPPTPVTQKVVDPYREPTE